MAALVQFVRLSYSYDQREVFELLADRVAEAAKASGDPGTRAKASGDPGTRPKASGDPGTRAKASGDPRTRAKGKCLELILAADALISFGKRLKTIDDAGQEG